jgi:hypothetical protein
MHCWAFEFRENGWVDHVGRNELKPIELADDLSLRTTCVGDAQELMDLHWGKHHRAYVDNLNKQIASTDLDCKSVVEIVRATWKNGSPTKEFNNAAQIWSEYLVLHLMYLLPSISAVVVPSKQRPWFSTCLTSCIVTTVEICKCDCNSISLRAASSMTLPG